MNLNLKSNLNLKGKIEIAFRNYFYKLNDLTTTFINQYRATACLLQAGRNMVFHKS